VWVELPGGMAAEIVQWGLHEKKSPSAVVTEVLEARRAARLGHSYESATPAPYDDGQPDAEKHARRTLTLFIPETELQPAEDAAAGNAVSLSRVVQHAWRRAHPFNAPSKR
jgi:hypothetical protein